MLLVLIILPALPLGFELVFLFPPPQTNSSLASIAKSETVLSSKPLTLTLRCLLA